LNPDALRTFTEGGSGGSWYTIWTVFSLMRWCQANEVAL
jgi:hypothetical protein